MITIRVLRGFEQIKPIYEMAKRNDCFVAGGYVRYMCSPHLDIAPASDVDVFGKDSEAVKCFVGEMRGFHDYELTFESEVAYTLESCSGWPKVQAVKQIEHGVVKTVGSLEEVISNFDFTVTRIGLMTEHTAMCDSDFLQDELDRTLVLRVINSPVQALMRANKYAKKGYFLPPAQAIKLFMDWDARSPEARARMIDFLTRSDEEEWSQEEIEDGEAMLRWGDDDDDDDWDRD